MSTTTEIMSLKKILNEANPSLVMDALRQIKFGDFLTARKQALTQTAAATYKLPSKVHSIASLRVTAGAAAAGDRKITDVGGTASTTVAKLGDDMQTLTFEDTVSAFTIIWVPASPTGVDLDQDYRRI